MAGSSRRATSSAWAERSWTWPGESQELHRALQAIGSADLFTIVGVEQPTMQSLRLHDGLAEPQYFIDDDDGRIDRGGDGTVYAEAATGTLQPVSSLPQSHGGLPRSPEVHAAVRAALLRRKLGPPMGGAALSLEIPDSVVAGEWLNIRVTSHGDAGGTRCRLFDAQTDVKLDVPLLTGNTGVLMASTRLRRPGIYRVEVQGGGFSPVTQLVMAQAPPGATPGGHE